jgi:hypothetical protein
MVLGFESKNDTKLCGDGKEGKGLLDRKEGIKAVKGRKLGKKVQFFPLLFIFSSEIIASEKRK